MQVDVAKMTSKGQIVIPSQMRKDLGLKAGSKLVLIEKEGVITLKKEEQIAKQLDDAGRQEAIGWMILAEQSLKKIWDNKKDEETWARYLTETEEKTTKGGK